MSLSGKTLFITGASRGIGLAIALRAARDGANIVDRRQDRCAPSQASRHDPYRGGGDREGRRQGAAARLRYPLRGSGERRRASDALRSFGGIDICVNNASAISLTGTLATEINRFDLMNQINARGTWLVSKACIPHLKRAANPHVLMLSPPLDMARQMVRRPHRLYDGEVRHEHVRAGHGGGIRRRRHRLQRLVAAHGDRHRRHHATCWGARRG